jgi:hypothetical protein
LIDKEVIESTKQLQSVSKYKQYWTNLETHMELILLPLLTNENPLHPPGPNSLHSYHTWLISEVVWPFPQLPMCCDRGNNNLSGSNRLTTYANIVPSKFIWYGVFSVALTA